MRTALVTSMPLFRVNLKLSHVVQLALQSSPRYSLSCSQQCFQFVPVALVWLPECWHSTGATSSAACVTCPAGQYSSGGTASCTPCSAGLYSAAPGVSSCNWADLGYYVPNDGAIAELPCPLGTYTDYSGEITCYPCDAGSYGSSTCQTVSTCTGTCSLSNGWECPPGSTTSGGIKCPPGNPCITTHHEGNAVPYRSNRTELEFVRRLVADRHIRRLDAADVHPVCVGEVLVVGRVDVVYRHGVGEEGRVLLDDWQQLQCGRHLSPRLLLQRHWRCDAVSRWQVQRVDWGGKPHQL